MPQSSVLSRLVQLIVPIDREIPAERVGTIFTAVLLLQMPLFWFSEELISNSSFLRRLARATVEFIRNILPETLIIIFFIVTVMIWL